MEDEGCLHNVITFGSDNIYHILSLLLDIFYPETKLKTIQNSKISRGTHVEIMTADTFTITDVAPVSQIFGASKM